MKTTLLATAIIPALATLLAILAACSPTPSQPPTGDPSAWAVRARQFGTTVPPSGSRPAGQVTPGSTGTSSPSGASGGDR
jgi:hypothetical protein